MLPGAIGSFDIIMLMELSMMGVSRSTALVWLVFFRVFYYLVPLIFGALMFVYHFCQKINRFFNGLPNLIWHQSAHVLITIFMYFSGILMLIDASMPDLTENNRFSLTFLSFYILLLASAEHGFVCYCYAGLCTWGPGQAQEGLLAIIDSFADWNGQYTVEFGNLGADLLPFDPFDFGFNHAPCTVSRKDGLFAWEGL